MSSRRSDKIFVYPRDKRGNRSGHCVCIKLIDGEMFSGVSLCSKDDEFNKAIGRKLAEERVDKLYKKVIAGKTKEPK